MDLSGKKLLICEEALINEKGHFQTWIKAIRQIHIDAGAEVFVAGNRSVAPEVNVNFNVLPIYSVNSWNQSVSGKWPPWRRQLRVFAQNWRVFSETRRALLQTGSVDVLFFTAVRVHHVIGLRLLCAWGLGRRFKRLCFFLLTSQAEYSEDFHVCHFPKQSKLIASVLRSIDRLARSGEVIVAGDSHITCREYEKLAGVPMTLFPSPGAGLYYQSSDKSVGGLTFTMLGVSSWDKGIDVFQAAILQFLERYPASEARFVLQWGVTCEGPGGHLIPISERLRNEQRVTLLERRLSNEEYADLFAAATFIVLPYRRKTYFNRLSGVLVEAACSGKPMIVTEGTWLEWAMHEFGCGLSVPEGDSSVLCDAMYLCSAEVRKFINEAKVRSTLALSYNSSERYLKLLWNELVYRDH